MGWVSALPCNSSPKLSIRDWAPGSGVQEWDRWAMPGSQGGDSVGPGLGQSCDPLPTHSCDRCRFPGQGHAGSGLQLCFGLALRCHCLAVSAWDVAPYLTMHSVAPCVAMCYVQSWDLVAVIAWDWGRAGSCC